jgi:ribonuclease BN (tRNA processing enzyme)
MKVYLGGARGSIPVSGSDRARYGGDTFALLIEDRDGGQVLVDAGSGVRRLVDRLRPGGTVFFTHTHLDHLIGMPMLSKCWPTRMILPRGDLDKALVRVFSPPVWPVKLPGSDLTVPTAPVEIGRLKVSWQSVAHPDGCVSYRVDEPATGAGVVVATDIEWQMMTPRAQDAFALFAHGADLLVFDSQYRPEEYLAHKGWGHSSWADAVEAARRSGAQKLWLMHHAPERTDDEIDLLAAEAAAMFKGAVVPTVETMTEILHE